MSSGHDSYQNVKFGADWTLHVKLVLNKSFPVVSRWRYDYNWIGLYDSGHDSTKHVKFGADWTLHV